MADIQQLDADMAALDDTLGGASAMAVAFDAQLRQVQGALGDTVRDLGALEKGFSNGLRRALDGVVLDGARLSDTLGTLAKSMVQTVYGAAMKPVTDHFGGLMAQGLNAVVSGLMPFAQGGAFSAGRVMPFAKGGVLTAPTTFPMRGGTGLMGEAGPEAIMPLTSMPDGSLGVRAAGGGTTQVTINITTSDVAGFQRSQSQIAAQMARALGQAQRNR